MLIPVGPRIIQHPGVRLEVDERQDLFMDCVVQGILHLGCSGSYQMEVKYPRMSCHFSCC